MIPIKIKLNNFMSYGENLEPLNFSNIELACLVGLNGVGKSSILEAMAWSLWGKSRAKSDDDLVKQGTEDMWVDFEFGLGTDKYRVVRKRTSKGKGQSNLEFYKHDDVLKGGDNWNAITGGTKNETQEIIVNTLKMTYDTFVNSAFLRQGKADEFTIKKPIERKRVLTEILNLSYYDLISDKAKEVVKKLTVENESFIKQMEYIEAEIKDKTEMDNNAKKMKKELRTLEDKLSGIEKELEEIKSKKEIYDKRIDQASYLDEKIKTLTGDLEKINIDITETHDKIEHNKKYLVNEFLIKKSYKRLVRLKEKENRYNELLKMKGRIEQDKNETEKNILNKKSEILQKKNNLDYRLEGIDKTLASKNKLKSQYDKLKVSLDNLDIIEQEKNNIENKLKIISERRNKYQAELKQIEIKGKDLKKKIIELEDAHGSGCPLCKQQLTHQHKTEVMNELMNLKKKEAIEFVNTRERIKECKNNEDILTKKIEESARELKVKPEFLSRMEIIKIKLKEINKLGEEKVKIENLLNDISSKLNTGTYDKGNHHKLEEIEGRLNKLKYNEVKHQSIKDEISELIIYEDKRNNLETVKASVKQQEEFLNKIIKNRIAKEKELLKSKEERVKIKVDYEKIEEVEKSISEKNNILLKIRAEINEKQGSFGAVNEKLERLLSLEKDLKKRRKFQIKIKKEKKIAEELVKAFGKNGIQAMIIEAAVPEIEQDANILLAKMTDDKMKIKLKTKKEKKTDGEMVDTLDILIEDDLGTRTYEMFSGGEAYRINFAIRIALSKLLANRTGAKLQFLVIDEGFGTQDSEGRENLIQAINSISSEFKKILVITHIQELKDVFPARIEINKNRNSSSYQVIV